MFFNAVIGLGSNIDAQRNIDRALTLLSNDMEIIKFSDVLKTEPIGITDQPMFFNAVVLVRCAQSLEKLVVDLKKIEDVIGRVRSRPKYGPRELDLDVVVYDGKIVDEDYHQRDFLRILVAKVFNIN